MMIRAATISANHTFDGCMTDTIEPSTEDYGWNETMRRLPPFPITSQRETQTETETETEMGMEMEMEMDMNREM